MSTWREQLRPASFRGVPFEVEGDRSPAGRRTQLHEFVQRDKPFVEDLGRRTRTFKLVGYVCGDDYLQKRDNLLNALDKPGAGELVHPWFGKLNVTASDDCEVTHERREGGLARFTLEFVESGDKGFPVGTLNTSRQVVKAKGGFIEMAAERFRAVMATVNAGRAKVTALTAAIMGPYNTASVYFGEALRTVNSVTEFIDKLIGQPAAFMGLFRSLSTGVGILGSSAQFGNFTSALQSLRRKSSDVKSLSTTYGYAGDSTTGAIARASQALIRDALIADLADEVAAIPVLPAPPPPPATPSLGQQVAQPVARADVPVTDDVLAARDAVDDALWSAALDVDHQQFERLEELRKAIYRHLTAVAAAGVRLVEIRPLTTEPALVTAYRRFADASRAGEIVTRNRVRHPGFVPPSTLLVAKE